MSLASVLLFAACSGEKQSPGAAGLATNAPAAGMSPGPAAAGGGAAGATIVADVQEDELRLSRGGSVIGRVQVARP